MVFQQDLLSWFKQNKRDLPWRKIKDPYAIWVSEMMLQQTQVKTVIPYFHRWLLAYPSFEHLAKADEQDLLSIWQGLGYYRRCKSLLQGAKWMMANGLPKTAKEWIKVPGVGPYTSAAVASIAFDEPAPLVDGNVERVFARLTGCMQEGRNLHQLAWEWAKKVLYAPEPGEWNQALMELGSEVCTPKSPSCSSCPVQGHCIAFQNKTVSQLPKITPKIKPVKLHHLVWVPYFKGYFGLRQIQEGKWWAKMWEFPKIDAGMDASLESLRVAAGEGDTVFLGKLKHAVTHHQIFIEFSLVKCQEKSVHLTWVKQEDMGDLALPSPQRKIFQKVLESFEIPVVTGMATEG